jgi:hypothetical protein
LPQPKQKKEEKEKRKKKEQGKGSEINVFNWKRSSRKHNNEKKREKEWAIDLAIYGNA